MYNPVKWLLFIFLSFVAINAASGDNSGVRHNTGTVIKIVDGDTFDMLTSEKKTIRIRMNGIDCPERKQDFYQAAKDALGRMIFKKKVEIIVTGRDRNRRVIATVFCNGQDINLAMVQNGYAWHYKKYSADSSLARAEIQARKKKTGLWAKPDPIAPWSFRAK